MTRPDELERVWADVGAEDPAELTVVLEPTVQDPPTTTAGAPQEHDLHQTRTAESAALITSNEVLFATAAAKGLPREDHRWAMLHRILSVLAFPASDAAAQDDSRPRYRPITRRLTYLEDARLEREMSRL